MCWFACCLAREKYWLCCRQDVPDLPTPTTPLESARNGFEFYRRLQTEDGHWSGEYGGPMLVATLSHEHADWHCALGFWSLAWSSHTTLLAHRSLMQCASNWFAIYSTEPRRTTVDGASTLKAYPLCLAQHWTTLRFVLWALDLTILPWSKLVAPSISSVVQALSPLGANSGWQH